MKPNVIVALQLLLAVGCTRQPADIAGDWTFVSGGRLSLTQAGSKVEGNGEWGDNPPKTIAVTGRVEGDQMMIVVSETPGAPVTFHYDLARSPKGNQRFLKCREWIGGSLIPAGVNYWEYDILKKEMTALRKHSESSQQDESTVPSEAAPSAPPDVR